MNQNVKNSVRLLLQSIISYVHMISYGSISYKNLVRLRNQPDLRFNLVKPIIIQSNL